MQDDAARRQPDEPLKHREHYRAGYSAGWSDGRNGQPMEDKRKCAMFFGLETCGRCCGNGRFADEECHRCNGTGEEPIAEPSPVALHPDVVIMDRVLEYNGLKPVAPPGAEGSVLDLPEAAFQSASAALSAPPATPGADLRPELPKRDSRQLAIDLRLRAHAITGASWEMTATVAMMREAAEMIERLAALLDAHKEP